MPLQRSRKHKMIAGVCGGIAEWLGWDPTVVRVLYVVGSILSAAFPGVLIYVVLWIVMPSEHKTQPPTPTVHALPNHPRPVEEWKYDPYTGEKIER